MTLPVLTLSDLQKWTEHLLIAKEELLDLAGRIGALAVLDRPQFDEEVQDINNGILLLVSVIERDCGEIALRSQGAMTLDGGVLR
jgi:hypothetical protein